MNHLESKHVTHQGGKGEPFHDWYPYLEGFSSEFVHQILADYLPKAKKIIEPFAGTGTVPVALSRFGIQCGYCEVNPAMLQVIASKIGLKQLSLNERQLLGEQLVELSQSLAKRVAQTKPFHEILSSSYQNNFKNSVFFDTNTFNSLLSIRSLNDTISNISPLLGNMLTVSVMSKIVLCSKLKRAGDVRYKTEKELLKGTPDLICEVSKHLLIIANDCFNSYELIGDSTLLTENAKNLKSNKKFEADGVITSPPYLNGTNYFRNTKLELWYSKFLNNGTSLRDFRNLAITSGINDVARMQGRVCVNPTVEELVQKLSENAYDQRIPRMVAGYFEDMKTVLEGLHQNCVLGASICIDIGDSRYGGVDVPTQDILALIGKDVGLKHVETIHLRSRTSKDKSKLSQSLIVLKKV